MILEDFSFTLNSDLDLKAIASSYMHWLTGLVSSIYWIKLLAKSGLILSVRFF